MHISNTHVCPTDLQNINIHQKGYPLAEGRPTDLHSNHFDNRIFSWKTRIKCRRYATRQTYSIIIIVKMANCISVDTLAQQILFVD